MATENNIIELRHVKKCYEKDTPVIKDFSLTIKKGEFVTFLGPSGCGKTTILRMIGGFEQPTGGEILLHGKDISKLPPAKRPINTVFQKYALFPYLNIYDNIAFGLKMKKMPKEVIREKVKKVLEVVDLEGFEKARSIAIDYNLPTSFVNSFYDTSELSGIYAESMLDIVCKYNSAEIYFLDREEDVGYYYATVKLDTVKYVNSQIEFGFFIAIQDHGDEFERIKSLIYYNID